MGRKRSRSTSSSSSSSDEETRILRKKLRKYRRKYKALLKDGGNPDASGSEGSDADKENRSQRGSPLPDEEPIHAFLTNNSNGERSEEEEIGISNDPLAVEATPLNLDIKKLLDKDIPVTENISHIIHNDLALRWTSILTKGLDPDIKKEILKKYPPAQNCPLMGAPKLNSEVKSVVNESALKRDERLACGQTQVGASLAALGRVLTILFEQKGGGGEGTNLEIIELLIDSSSMLADIHHQESESRRSLVSLTLKKEMMNTLTDTAVDGWLFGKDLGDRVKAAKAIEKSGQDLRRNTEKHEKKRTSSLNLKGPFKQPGRLNGPTFQRNSRTYHTYQPKYRRPLAPKKAPERPRAERKT